MNRFWGVARILLVIWIILAVGAFFVWKAEDMKPEETVETAAETTEAAQLIEPTAATVMTQPETHPAETEALKQEVTEYDTVPLYFQTDYPNIKFGNGTIATSGCSMTCLAMVATYLTDQEYMPDELVYHFGSFGKTNIERLEHGNEQMGLPNVRTENVQEVLQALRDGKVVIAMMDDESIFTTEQHFIVLTGMTEDGKILVNDPMEPNYTASVYMEKAYISGFGDYDIMRGFSGAWIYDKNAIPQDYVPFNAEKPQQEENRYDGYELPEEDIYVLACYAWAVARDQTEEVQQAVLEVILNRVVSEDFPNTVHDVIYRGELYDKTMERAAPDFPQYRAVTAAMYGPYVLPEDVYYFSQWWTSGDVWGELGKFTFLYSH